MMASGGPRRSTHLPRYCSVYLRNRRRWRTSAFARNLVVVTRPGDPLSGPAQALVDRLALNADASA